MGLEWESIAAIQRMLPYKALSVGTVGRWVIAGVCYDRVIVPPAALLHLGRVERKIVEELSTYARPAFVAGRLALRAALNAVPGSPTCPEGFRRATDGAPALPGGFMGSITHKACLALAVAGADCGVGVGIDLESKLPERSKLSDRILNADEMKELRLLSPCDLWPEVLARFSLKEAAFKSLTAPLRYAIHSFKQMSVRMSGIVRSTGVFQDADIEIASDRLPVALVVHGMVALLGKQVLALSWADCQDAM
jgi:4'-phosphopantetheinyl transferase EntD